MSVKQRDPLTGHQTTGHEWNGITELNTRVPRAVWWFIGITHLYALVVWILMPAWPLFTTYTPGLLGADQRQDVARDIAAARQARAAWVEKIADLPVDEIRADPVLMTRVRDTAPALFGDNCAPCHGAAGAGGPGYPSLVDTAWLWGGDADAILETLRVGINARHPETRIAQMPAFGADRILDRAEIRATISYLRSLSEDAASPAGTGAEIFAENCASCHGETGGGNTDLGAPDLRDASWIHGGDHASLFETIWAGRQGWMPAWEDRLSLADRKVLTLYLQDLAGEEQP